MTRIHWPSFWRGFADLLLHKMTIGYVLGFWSALIMVKIMLA